MSKNYYVVKKVLSLDFLKTLKTSGEREFSTVDGIKFFYYPEKVATFLKNNTCICCGLTSSEVRIERGKGSHKLYSKPHLNVYGTISTEYGEYTDMITVDHDILKSKGGADTQDNFNTMCQKCNKLRGSKFEVLSEFLEKYKPIADKMITHRASCFINNKIQWEIRKPKLTKAEREEKERLRKERSEEYKKTLFVAHIGSYNRYRKKLYKEQKLLTEQK